MKGKTLMWAVFDEGSQVNNRTEINVCTSSSLLLGSLVGSYTSTLTLRTQLWLSSSSSNTAFSSISFLISTSSDSLASK